MSSPNARSASISPVANPASILQFLIVGAWFGLMVGLIEGLGLLLFQRINWENWARMLHVSGPIVWISPLVDLAIFLPLALGGWCAGRLFPRLPVMRIMIFLFAGLAVYDWFALMGRLYYFACLLLAIGAANVFQRWFTNHQSPALHFWNKTLPLAIGLVVLAFAFVQGRAWWTEHQATAHLPPAEPGSPNVLVIIMDALRADHVSSYGYSRATSPAMDRLAAEGVLFENAMSATSWSLPSHVSLVTGRFQYEHGASSAEPQTGFDWGHPSFRGFPMLGEALGAHGYRTAAISANRVFFTQNDGFGRGFQHFADYFHSTKDAIFRTLYGREFVRLYLGHHGTYRLHKRATEVNHELLEWIDRDSQRPFLAVLNYFDVHDPYGGPGNYPKPAWELKTELDEYDAGVKYCDDQLGFLMNELARRGLANNTIVMITGDHGESLGQHGLRTHGRALYRELIHVPLIVWSPGRVPAGVVIDRPVSNASIPATAVELAVPGAENPFPVALGALWKDPRAAANWPAPLAELGRNPYPEKEEKTADQIEPTSTTGYLRSLVTPEWHLISHENLGDQLYDWKHDPEEKTNLASTLSGSAIARNLASSFPPGTAVPSGEKPDLAQAKTIGNGTFNLQPGGPASKSVNHYFRLLAAPGSTVTVEVRSRHLKPASRLDPVLAIQDGHGQLLQSCRNPGDDHLAFPAVSDPTPLAFDDLCINDDVAIGTNLDSRLEFMASASGSDPVEFYVHVLDWNELVPGRKAYQLMISGALQRPDSEPSGGEATSKN